MYGKDNQQVMKQKIKINTKQGSPNQPGGQITTKQKIKVKIKRQGSGGSSSDQENRRNVERTGMTTGTQPVGTTTSNTTGYTGYDTGVNTGLNTGITGPGTGLTGGNMHPTTTQTTTQKVGFVQKVKQKLHPGHHQQYQQ